MGVAKLMIIDESARAEEFRKYVVVEYVVDVEMVCFMKTLIAE
jgi:hypothetical protein